MRRALVGILLLLTLAGCGDSSTGPGPQTNSCTGTCLVVENASTDLTIDEVLFTTCEASSWGSDRLGSDQLDPGGSRGWQVTAGCWDIRARADEGSEEWISQAFGVALETGETYTLVFNF